jgi:hypothetical protein
MRKTINKRVTVGTTDGHLAIGAPVGSGHRNETLSRVEFF